MKIVPATFPSMGIDTVTHLDAAHCASLRTVGIDFAIRYLGGITPDELVVILASGLGLSLVTFSRGVGWLPSATLGATDAAKDLAHLAELAIPKGATIWIDLEGCGGNPATTSDWVNARSAALSAAGYDVGLYVGGGDVLDAGQLYALPHVDRYWKSLSNVPTPACGWSMIQLYNSVEVGGVWSDVDVIQVDYKLRVPNIIRG